MATNQGVKLLMLVDDEPTQRRLISAIAARAGWRTIFAPDCETALAMLGTQDGMALDVVIIDHHESTADIERFAHDFRVARPALPLLVLCGDGVCEQTVAAMRAGATDLFHKPVTADRLIAALTRLCGEANARGEMRRMIEKLGTPLDFDAMIGAAPAYRSALAIAAKAARSRTPILIEGERGVGKLQVAQAVHAASPRARGPFITVDCGAIEPRLMGSILFGHESGAFAGAFERQVGRMTLADGGSLFLDRIETLPPELQDDLLLAVETGLVRPLGSGQAHAVDFRVISAADCNLAQRVSEASFREELFTHLAGVQLHLPPLRERTGDVASLARHLLQRFAAYPGMRALSISDEALHWLGSYHWPGNVRQLQDVLFRAAVSCTSDAITPVDLTNLQAARLVKPVAAARSSLDAIGVTLYAADGNLRPLSDIEADVIRLAIGHYRGRMSEVARRLGIGRSTLYRKLADLGIDTAA